MAYWFQIENALLIYLAVLGLWVVLVQSPLLRHVTWSVSRRGRRSKTDFVPTWTRKDYEDYLLDSESILAELLYKLLTCTACQSMHAAWVCIALYWVRVGLNTTVSPALVLDITLASLAMVAIFFATFKTLSKQ